MPTDYELALFCSCAYDLMPSGTIIDHNDLRLVIDGDMVTVRGTVLNSFENWLRDFDALPLASDFGMCHAGFLHGALNLLPLVLDRITPNYVLTGHSLGGAIVIILGAMLVRVGKPPSRLVTFEAPKAGGMQLRMPYANISVTQYRYGNDPVTDVPFLPGVYEHLRDLTNIGQRMIDPIDCHHISRTVEALKLIDSQLKS